MVSHWYGFVNAVLNAIVGGSVYRIRSMGMAGIQCECSRAEAMCFFAWIPFGISGSGHTMACQHFVLVAKHPTCLFGPVSIQIATNSNYRQELNGCCLWHLWNMQDIEDQRQHHLFSLTKEKKTNALDFDRVGGQFHLSHCNSLFDAHIFEIEQRINTDKRNCSKTRSNDSCCSGEPKWLFSKFFKKNSLCFALISCFLRFRFACGIVS